MATGTHPRIRILLGLAGAGSVMLLGKVPSGPPAGWFTGVLSEFRAIASTGRDDLHLSGIYWHLPFAYSPERRSRLNDAALWVGLGRSVIDAKDNERGLLFQVSRSSHFKPQYVAGYWWQARWRVTGKVRAGAGYTAFVFARSDIYHYLPLPGVVPLVSVGTDDAALYLTYLPRIHNAITGTGNVLYLYARVRL